MPGPSFYQKRVSNFRPSNRGGAGAGRLIFTGGTTSDIENHYVVGATVGAQSIAVRRALLRRANNSAQGTPCGHCPTYYQFGEQAYLAMRSLKSSLDTPDGSVILVGKRETLESDNVVDDFFEQSIKHYYPGSTDWNDLNETQKKNVKIINELLIQARLKVDGEYRDHVVGYATYSAQTALINANPSYGLPVEFGPRIKIMTYGVSTCIKDHFESQIKSILNKAFTDIVYSSFCTDETLAASFAQMIALGGPEDPLAAVVVEDSTEVHADCQFLNVKYASVSKQILESVAKDVYSCSKKEVISGLKKYL
jgi:hypothetical protein